MTKNKIGILSPAGEGYSKSQREAIETFGVDLAVAAGPGSGKTRVLVERFLRAATAEGVSPERILAITFTEKAAQEMKSRLVRLCQSRGLSDLRKRLENASVSTIDSFCARILKENPVEAGVDPRFKILGEGEAELLMNRLLDDIFQKEADSARWLGLLVDHGEEAMRGLLKKYYFKTRAEKNSQALLTATDHPALRRETAGRVGALCQRILAETGGRELKAAEAGLRQAALEIAEILKAGAAEADWAVYARVQNALKKIKRTGRLKALAEESQALAGAWLECLAETIARPVKEEFVRVFRLFENAYGEEKKRLAAHDFADLLLKAHDLLGGGTPARQQPPAQAPQR